MSPKAELEVGSRRGRAKSLRIVKPEVEAEKTLAPKSPQAFS